VAWRLPAVGVHVVHVGADAVGGEGVEVVRQVARTVGLLVDGRDARVVLGREDENAVRGLDLRGVGERVALDRAARGLEPDLDGVARTRARDAPAHDPVVDVADVTEPFAAGPFRRPASLDGAGADLVLERDGSEAPPRQHLHGLRISV
jgi:hypothetical protein